MRCDHTQSAPLYLILAGGGIAMRMDGWSSVRREKLHTTAGVTCFNAKKWTDPHA